MSEFTATAFRLGFFGSVLLTLRELLAPRRQLTIRRAPRWGSNLTLVVLNIVAARLPVPIAAGMEQQFWVPPATGGTCSSATIARWDMMVTRKWPSAFPNLENDWSRIVDEEGNQLAAVGHHFQPSRAFIKDEITRISR